MNNHINTWNGKDLFWLDLLNSQEQLIHTNKQYYKNKGFDIFNSRNHSSDWLKILNEKKCNYIINF